MGIKQVLVNILILVLVSPDVLLDVVLEARFYHVVLVYSDVLALSWAFVLRELIVVHVGIRLRAVVRIIILLLCRDVHVRLLAHGALVAPVSPVTEAMGRTYVLWLLLMLVRASALVALSASLVLLLLASSSLPAPLVVSWLRLLMARIELVADTAVLHAGADYVREPVVVALHFQRVGDDRLNPVVVSHYLYLINYAKGRVS